MTVRLHPRCNAIQKVEYFKLKVQPPPSGSSENIDLYSNNISTLWFNDKHDYLTIHASSIVNVADIDPFDFIIIEEEAKRLPITYRGKYSEALKFYSRPRYQSSLLDNFIHPILARSKGETTSFLLNLTMEISKQFSGEFRESGEPLQPNVILARHSGACRDLALLFMECCRSVGLAARFVSGYGYGDSTNSMRKRDMHAWVEIYLPGGGWRAFDPSIGLAVAGDHVAVATAADPEDASPTCGMFRGTGVQSELEYDVSISRKT